MVVGGRQLPGFCITEQLYSGSRTLVYRGIRESDQKPVAIKLLKREYPTLNELLQFRNQFVLASELDLPGIVKPYSLEPYCNGYALIMEDFGGISLAQRLKQLKSEGHSNRALPLPDFLAIALQLATILDGLYRHQVIHKDIKPANVLINLHTTQIKLIDFSIASRLPRETQVVQTPQHLEGTLAYLSPEQTGRMNRGVDYRTDFYSLGVTFYELLTGQLPYASSDPMELVYSHIARQPTPVHQINPAVPPVVSAMVEKLMAKNAEDRYQSALGLKHDLEYCLDQWQQTEGLGISAAERIAPLELGQCDRSERFTLPEKLYGREHELATLLKAFGRVTQGQRELVIVAGPAGIGKTALVQEVQKPIVQHHGYFITGRFDPFQRDVPFSALIQAFRGLINQLLGESDTQLNHWKTKMLQVLGPQAQMMTEVLPELEHVIGDQPSVLRLNGHMVQHRFKLLFQKLIQVFTTPEHPLVIFLDDLQWADSASLQLIKLLMEEVNGGYLLLIGAYRDYDIASAHPLKQTLDDLFQAGAPTQVLHLTPLALEDVNQLVTETLTCPLEMAYPLTELIYQNAKGSPFFTTQCLKSLYDEHLITFSPELGYWQCDLTAIKTAALTDDVVEFMTHQLQKLPTETQIVLKYASCIGHSFDLATLAAIAGYPQSVVAHQLWRSLQQGLIIASDETVAFCAEAMTLDAATLGPVSDDAMLFWFLHDRVQQAAYSLIPIDEKQAIHFRIGQRLLEQLSPERLSDEIFTVVNQLNQGKALAITERDRDQLVKLNLMAAGKAKLSTAYDIARQYLETGRRLLSEDAWTRLYDLTLDLHTALVEVAYLTGDGAAVERWTAVVCAQVHSLLDSIRVRELQVLSLVAQKEVSNAIAVGLDTLSALGYELSPHPTSDDIARLHAEITARLPESGIEALRELPPMRDRHALAAMQIANAMSLACYLSAPHLFQLLVLTQVKLSIGHGNTAISATAYARYGIVLCGAMQEIETGYRFGQLALSLLDTLDDPDVSARTLLIVGWLTQPWKQHLSESLPLFQASYAQGLESGNLEPAALSHYYETFCMLLMGSVLADLEQHLETYGEHMAQLNQEMLLGYHKMLHQVVLNLLGQNADPCCLTGTAFDETQALAHYQATHNVFALFTLHLYRAIARYWFGQPQQAIAELAPLSQYASGVMASPLVPVATFYDSLIRLACYPALDGTAQADALLAVEANQHLLRQWATQAPVNYQHKFELVCAEYQRILGQTTAAAEFYDRAIANANRHGFMHEEAIANELACQFYLGWNKPRLAQEYLLEAYYGYARWGARAKVEDLEQRYPTLLTPVMQQPSQPVFMSSETIVASVSTHAPTSSSTAHHASLALDMAAILKASQTLSSEIQLDKLLSKLLELVVENAGADKCVMLLQGETDLVVKAIVQGNHCPAILQSRPLDKCEAAPISLINSVKHSRQPVVIFDARTHATLEADPYILKQQPQSVLCNPILYQGKLLGILYLENSLAPGVFTHERVEILTLLCAQAAISLENARLYEQSQQALENYKRTQTFLRLVIDNIPQLIFWKDRNSVYLGGNAALTKAAGLSSPDDIVGKTDYDLPWTNEEAEFYRLCDRRVMQSGQPELHILETQKQSDGRTVWNDANKIPLRDDAGNVIGILGTVEDVTQRIQAEQLLKRQKEELEQALSELQRTQMQLVQNEKMSALGNLVAGVAHEINNPVGFLAGNLQPAQDYIRDLFALIDRYQEQFPDPGQEIEDEITAIDLDYVREDLPRLLESMKLGIDRIRNISTSLRTFSRADKDYKVPFSVHDGIDSTVLILKHRLKANERRPAIEVIKEYGDIPPVACFPGQLNQVFMNILANAIDALEEGNANRRYEEIQANPNCITIHTEVANESDSADGTASTVVIRIRDNGIGMSEAVQQCIFDHLFTTKAVGHGTGLGLAIAHQIVVEKHGGTLAVHSAPGEGAEFVITLPIKDQP